jgi:hypothetical protein
LKLADVKAGDVLIADAGFTCIEPDARLTVYNNGSYLAVRCARGTHALDGQLNDKGELVGFRKESVSNLVVLWELLHPEMTHERLGLIPWWIFAGDPDPAWKQIHKHYEHGGGWRHGNMGFRMLAKHVLRYPGDPDLYPLAQARLRDELILFYDHAIVAILQKDGSFEASRVD